MNVSVIITGLVLLIPDPANNQLHVLFPQTSAMSPAERHAPILWYRGRISDTVFVPLTAGRLDLSGLGYASAGTIPTQVINIGKLTRTDIPSDIARGIRYDPSLTGIISLPFPETITPGKVAPWYFAAPGTFDPYSLTNQVTLTFRLKASTQDIWTHHRYAPTNPLTTPLEMPDVGGGSLRLHITSAPPQAPKIGLWEEAKHFRHYLDVLGVVEPRPALLLAKKPPWALKSANFLLAPSVALSPYNCMLAWAPITPPSPSPREGRR